jgi:hypothetical protein
MRFNAFFKCPYRQGKKSPSSEMHKNADAKKGMNYTDNTVDAGSFSIFY